MLQRNEGWSRLKEKPSVYSNLTCGFAIQTVETHGTKLWYQLMDLDAETPTHDQRSMCVPTIGELRGSLRVLSLLWDGIIINSRAYLSYIDKSHRGTLTRNFFTKKLTSTNPIGSLISGTRSSLTLSRIIFSVSINPTWSDVRLMACEPHDFLQLTLKNFQISLYINSARKLSVRVILQRNNPPSWAHHGIPLDGII